MYYKEYVRAASRHLSTCKNLIHDIEHSNKPQADKNHWLCEVYYLSGYIIECMLSYVLFYQYNDHVHTSHFYCQQFLSHNLPSKTHHVINVAKKQLNGVPLISVAHHKKNINNLFSKWDVCYRYEPLKKQSPADIILYINIIEEVKKIILNKYPLL